MNIFQSALNPKNRVKVIGLVIVLIIVGYFGYTKVFAQQKKPQYQTAAAQRGTLVVSIAASGQVSSVNNSPVNTQTSGVVTKVYVHNGDKVKAGQKIAEVSLDADGKQRRASAYASYQSAVSSENSAENSRMVDDAQMWKDQQSVLLAQDTVNNRNSNNTNPATKLLYTDLQWQSVDSANVNAQKQFLASETKYVKDDTAVNSAKASIASTYLTYQQSSPVIVAPIDGVVDGLSLELGEIITQQTTTTTSTNTPSVQKVATIKTEALPMVTTNLTEIDIPNVQIGDRATLTFDAFPGKTYTGKVVSIDSESLVSSGVTTYPTVIQLDTEVPGLFANMTASANVITQTKDNVLLVPSGAVQTQNGQQVVREVQNGQLQSIPVTVGLSSDTQTEVTSGVAEGDNVVTSVITGSAGGATTGNGGSSPFSRTFGGGGGGGGGARILTGGRGG